MNLIVPSNPTPNGDLHLGHIAGPFLGADVLRRAGGGAVLLGTAWQNSHVLLAAQREGRDYLEVAAEFADRIERSFAAAGIGYDVMLRHADIPAIEQVTRAAFARLRAEGDVVVRDAWAQYCTGCDDWRFQGHVDGRCPHCGSPDASGIDCEGCGIYHDDADLLDARCAVCGATTTLRSLSRAFLDLERRRAWFEEYLGAAVLGPPVRAYAESVLARPLPRVAVTACAGVGVPAGHSLTGQRIYPSFELAPRYAVMVRRLGGVAATATASMLFGYDNAFERVFLFPAVLRALPDEGAPMPDVLQMTHFYLLDGAKFSTSRGHVVGVQEMVDAHGLDTVRLFLAASRPERGTTNFSLDAVAGSASARAVRRLRGWADTGRPPEEGETRGDARARLDAAATELDRALRPASLSCVRAAEAIAEIAEIAGTPDPVLREAVRCCLLRDAAALIPETADRLGTAVEGLWHG